MSSFFVATDRPIREFERKRAADYACAVEHTRLRLRTRLARAFGRAWRYLSAPVITITTKGPQ